MLQIIGWIIVIWLTSSAILWIIDDIRTYLLLGNASGVERILAQRERENFNKISSVEEAREKGIQFANEIRFRNRNLLRKISLQVVKIGIAIFLIYILTKNRIPLRSIAAGEPLKMLNILGWIVTVLLIGSFLHSMKFHLGNYINWRLTRTKKSDVTGHDIDKIFYKPFLKRVMFIQLIKLIIIFFLLYKLIR